MTTNNCDDYDDYDDENYVDNETKLKKNRAKLSQVKHHQINNTLKNVAK